MKPTITIFAALALICATCLTVAAQQGQQRDPSNPADALVILGNAGAAWNGPLADHQMIQGSLQTLAAIARAYGEYEALVEAGWRLEAGDRRVPVH